MEKLIILAFLLFTGFNTGYTQAITNQQLEKLIDDLLIAEFKPAEPGISVLIAKKGQVIYKKAFGSANLELNVPLHPDMIFRIGSVTKQFTAIAILQLVEQGKISLQDSIQKYVKEFPSKDATITIEHLLTHTSGIKEYTAIDHPDPYMDRHDLTPFDIINHFKNTPLEFKPGSHYAYSNSGYMLLGYLIEKVTGKKYHDYMNENIIKRAGLNNTLYADEKNIVPRRVAGYTRDRGFYENTYFQSVSLAYAVGDLFSTTEDLYTWNNALLTYKLVKKETLEKAFTPYTLTNGVSTKYGYGWFINSSHGHKCIHHEGQVSGFIAAENYFPELDTYVVVLTNVKSGEDKTDFSDRRFRLFDKIIALAVGDDLQKGTIISDNILDSYTGTYQLVSNANRTIVMVRDKDKLVAKITGQGSLSLVFQSTTKFSFEGLAGATGEFITENGKVAKFIISQNGEFEWKKIK